MNKLACVGLCLFLGCANNNSGDDSGAGSCAPTDDASVPSVDDLAMTGGNHSPDLGRKAPDMAQTALPTVFIIVLENQDYADIVGSANAPYINSLIAQYGLATNYQDSGSHPSLPNYLYMVSGDTQGISSDFDPTQNGAPFTVDNLGNQLETNHVAWRAYAESMNTPCKLISSGSYYARHVPFLYFDDVQNGANSVCRNRVVDYSQFAADLASNGYRLMWITPNGTDDGHDPALDPATGLMDSDNWLSREVPKILASAGYKANGALFITWDEAEGRNGNSGDQVPMIVISPKLKSAGYQSSTAFDHSSWLATVEDWFKLPRLGAAAQATSLAEFFQ